MNAPNPMPPSDAPPSTPPPAPRSSRGLGRTLLIGVLVAVAVGVLVRQGVERSRRVKDVAGKVAPTFTLERFAGGKVSLAELRGKVVMLDFWATWCPPCRAEMPDLTKLAQEYASKGVVFVAANQDDQETQKTEVSAFVRKLPALKDSVVLDDGTASNAYGIQVLPTLYFIGKNGEILDAYTSYASEGTLRERIDRALAEAK